MFTQLLLMAAAVLVAGSLEGLEAQERPDFSGTWVVERVESERLQANVGSGRRGGGQGGGRAGRGGQGRRGGFGVLYQEGARVTLRQTNEALIVTDEARSLMSRYPFDGQEASNPGPGDRTVRSKTSWEGATLVIESALSVAGPRGDMTLRTREVRA